MRDHNTLFWKDLAAAGALAVVVFATLHLPLFA